MPLFVCCDLKLSTETTQGAKSLGWTVIDAFRDVTLSVGRFYVPLRRPPTPDPSKVLLSPAVVSQSSTCGDALVYFRIVHGDVAVHASAVAVDPDAHAGTESSRSHSLVHAV